MKVCFSQLFVKSITHNPKGRCPHAFDAGGKILWALGRPKGLMTTFPYMCSNGKTWNIKKTNELTFISTTSCYPARRIFLFVFWFWLFFSRAKELSQWTIPFLPILLMCSTQILIWYHVPSFNRLVSCPVKLERRLDEIMLISFYGSNYCITSLFSRAVTWVIQYRAALGWRELVLLRQAGPWCVSWVEGQDCSL